MSTIFFRGPNARIEHLTRADSALTLCGADARLGARYGAGERGVDAKVRPLCPRCRAALTR